jgi:hypothetical protein
MPTFKALTNLCICAIVLGAGGTAASAQTDTNEFHNQRVEPVGGSWIFSVRGLNGSFSFTALASFAAGGVFLATGSGDRIIPVSPIYGTWRRAGRNRFNATADFFAFDSTGNPVAMNHIVQSFELNGYGELIGVGEFSECDVQGENCHRTPQTDFSVTAQRIVAADLTDLGLPPI